tara:strand:+ start:472 stop:777 length:306 start_codon:yes stop_codon:yes gene_type:complete
MIRLFFYILIILFLNSCGGFSEAGKVLRNEKTKTTDEFLVKKREPLSQPPDMDKIPEPGSVIKSKQNENNVNKILKVPKEINNRSNSSSSLEKSILDEIKK